MGLICAADRELVAHLNRLAAIKTQHPASDEDR